MEIKNLAGSVKVAIFLKSLGENACEKIFNNLSGSEKETVRSLMSQVGDVPSELVEKVAEEFTEMVGAGKTAIQKGTEQDDKNLQGDYVSGKLDAIHSLKAEQLVKLIKDEHPQTIAIIIIHLKIDTASDVLAGLPDEIKTDVARRIANLDKVVSGTIEEIDKVLEGIVKENESSATRDTNGVSKLAEILNNIDSSLGGMILDELEETDSDLVEQIKQLMFVFDDLVLVDDRGLQKVLRSVETKELALSLKAASEEVKEKIFKNMSVRASEILKEEIESLGAVRMKDVADAQQNVTVIIQDMESKGEVIISGRGGDEFI